MSTVKLLLARKADYSKIKYPVLATPKLDGIRCAMVDGVAMSRNMKPIPNHYIRKQLEGLHGLDGELMVNGDFNEVQSGIMSAEGEPDFTFHVFDQFKFPDKSYFHRMEDLEWFVGYEGLPIKILYPVAIHNEEELNAYLDKCLEEGYEGIMIRDPKGKYKFGRSTVNEGILLKIKKFLDDEATLVEIVEKMINDNPLEEDELGRAKRSSHKDNKTPANTAGAVVLNWNGIVFNVGFGPGFTDAIKQAMWDQREELKGKLFKFSYQELSKDGIPRFGKLLGERHKDDL
tara:strand:+ start:810 stop:1673 length:864 start_codon:yes stop_codon:yes gene_type:complete